jgi:hypothetical protein
MQCNQCDTMALNELNEWVLSSFMCPFFFSFFEIIKEMLIMIMKCDFLKSYEYPSRFFVRLLLLGIRIGIWECQHTYLYMS